MIKDFSNLSEHLKNGENKIKNKVLGNYVNQYDFLFVSKKLNHQDNFKIYQNMKQSNIVIINQSSILNQNSSNDFLIISFQYTIIIINSHSLQFLQNLFSNNANLRLCFLSNTKKNFDDNIDINYLESKPHQKLDSEIKNFDQNISLIYKSNKNNIWEIIKPSISAYLILNSYSKLNKNRLSSYFNDQNKNLDTKINIDDESEFITLRTVGNGTIFRAELIYHIKREELFVIKTNFISDNEYSKLIKREIDNYSKIRHPLLPIFYGTSKINKDDVLIIEYINGTTLEKVTDLHLNDKEKITIIYEIMLVIKYLHNKGYVYRDLKHNNIMIDENKTVVLIDFDRLILNDSIHGNVEITQEFQTIFADPNINSNKFSYEVDIFSIGQMIYYLMNEKMPFQNNLDRENDFKNFKDMKSIYSKCINDNIKKRPNIYDLADEFYNKYESLIEISSENLKKLKSLVPVLPNKNDIRIPFKFKTGTFSYGEYIPDEHDGNNYYVPIDTNENFDFPIEQLILGAIYSQGKIVPRNIEESIHQYKIAADQNNADAQFHLGLIYYEDKDIPRDINKSIYYFSLAANQNYAPALYNLGRFYFNGIGVEKDINKAIHYFILASDNNFPEADFELGYLYSQNECVPRDINKAIHYYTLASNHCYPTAQHNLANIYMRGEYVPRDMKMAIHYYELAAKGNFPESQYSLGLLYSEGIHVARDINKAIFYLTLASKHNKADAQYKLGSLYYIGGLAPFDINKAINYFQLAANQNHPEALFKLGAIYQEGQFVPADYKRAIHYYTLSANQNNPAAQLNLGMLYLKNEHVKHDIKKGIHYIQLAADQGIPNAQHILGSIYYENKYVLRDINKAIYYLSRAADQDFYLSQHNLGIIFYEGKYIERDINKAFHYFNLSLRHQYAPTQVVFSEIYYEGKYVRRDVDKAIYYLLLASKQNDQVAQLRLGLIYYTSPYIPHDINKAIHYFSLAAEQQNPKAQFCLGHIYCEGKDVQRNVKAGINYYLLSANQNFADAQKNLGIIYYEGKIVPRDIKKAITYLSLAANQSHEEALYLLGEIYYDGVFVPQNINKAIHFYSLAANQDHSESQYIIGLMLFEDFDKSNKNKGIGYLTRSSNNGNVKAHFTLGYLHHEGRFVEKNINKAIHYYKEASTLNDEYAKNNLGVLNKNGFGENYKKNVGMAIQYFEEAIKQNNEVAMYNLAHMYLYDDSFETNNDNKKIFELLIESSNRGFPPSIVLLCLALVKKFGFDLNNIKIELEKFIGKKSNLLFLVCNMIKDKQFDNRLIFDIQFQRYKKIDFVFNHLKFCFISDVLLNQKSDQNHKEDLKKKNLSQAFYEGFGCDLDD